MCLQPLVAIPNSIVHVRGMTCKQGHVCEGHASMLWGAWALVVSILSDKLPGSLFVGAVEPINAVFVQWEAVCTLWTSGHA